MLLHDTFDTFDTWLRDHKSASTAHVYRYHASVFLRHLGPQATPKSLTTTVVRSYITGLSDRYRPRSVHGHLAGIRAYCTWLVEQGYLNTNPASQVKAPRLDAPRRDTPDNNAVIELLGACDRIGNPYRRLLARAVVSTLVYSGLRRIELLRLNRIDIDLKHGCLYVRHGKGDNARTVFPHADCITAIGEYLTVRPEGSDRLFMLRRNIPFGDEGLRTLLRDLQAIAGMPGSTALLPHGLRHACATRLDHQGASLNDIKEFLGHSDIQTTAIYLHAGEQRLQQIAHLTALQPNAAPPPVPTTPPAAPASTPPAARDLARQRPNQPARRSIRIRP